MTIVLMIIMFMCISQVRSLSGQLSSKMDPMDSAKASAQRSIRAINGNSKLKGQADDFALSFFDEHSE